MVKINTRDFGEIEIAEEYLYTFPAGILAFEDTRHFALICPHGHGQFPMWLQCTDDILPCFIVCDAKTVAPDFTADLTAAEESVLRVSKNSDLTALFIANVSGGVKNTTVNMKSPIIINEDYKIALQVILPGNYDFRFKMFKDVNAKIEKSSQPQTAEV